VITGAGLDPSCTPAGIPPNGSHGEGCWGRLPQVEKELNPIPGSYKPDGLWETHAQPGAMRPGKRRVLPDTPEGRLDDLVETAKAHIRAKVEHPFRVI
jgi:hypothetical protein